MSNFLNKAVFSIKNKYSKLYNKSCTIAKDWYEIITEVQLKEIKKIKDYYLELSRHYLKDKKTKVQENKNLSSKQKEKVNSIIENVKCFVDEFINVFTKIDNDIDSQYEEFDDKKYDEFKEQASKLYWESFKERKYFKLRHYILYAEACELLINFQYLIFNIDEMINEADEQLKPELEEFQKLTRELHSHILNHLRRMLNRNNLCEEAPADFINCVSDCIRALILNLEFDISEDFYNEQGWNYPKKEERENNEHIMYLVKN